MRRPIEDHRGVPWRAHEYAADFDLLDVWRYPVRLGRDVTLATFLDFLSETQAEIRDGRSLTARLFRLRGFLGRIFGWDREPAPEIPEERATTVSKTDARRFLGFQSVYATDAEVLFELENATVHALLHLGRVEWTGDLRDPREGEGDWAAQMAVYVQRRGLLGRFYMALISPFRHYIVYPMMMRNAREAWPAYASRHALD